MANGSKIAIWGPLSTNISAPPASGHSALRPTVVPGQLGAQSLDEVVAESRRIVEDFLVDSPTPGLSIAVHLQDSLVWAEGFGLANVEYKVPVTPETLFRIGSVSKAFTAAAVGLLHERGLLDFDAPIQDYVPSFPEKAHPITTRQLGGHLSGLPHYGAEDYKTLFHTSPSSLLWTSSRIVRCCSRLAIVTSTPASVSTL